MEQNERSVEATLKFYLPENQSEFETAANGWKWKAVAWDLSQALRKRLKWEEGLSEEKYQGIEECQDELFEIINGYSLNLD